MSVNQRDRNRPYSIEVDKKAFSPIEDPLQWYHLYVVSISGDSEVTLKMPSLDEWNGYVKKDSCILKYCTNAYSPSAHFRKLRITATKRTSVSDSKTQLSLSEVLQKCATVK